MKDDLITAVIPTIPTRGEYFHRALKSVRAQLHPVYEILWEVDHNRTGSAATRNRILSRTKTEWCAFLDDDDEWMPHHLSTLIKAANETGADILYPWFEVPVGFDPWPGVFGREFDSEELSTRNYIPVTVLARTDIVKSVGGFEPYGDQKESACDDWGLWRKLLEAGATFHHVPEHTWYWHWHGQHTSGLGNKE